MSPRSGQQHRAWGASPRYRPLIIHESAKRPEASLASLRTISWYPFRKEHGADNNCIALSAASRTCSSFWHAFLGLAPQALCFCPLRGLLTFVRFADYSLFPLRGLLTFVRFADYSLFSASRTPHCFRFADFSLFPLRGLLTFVGFANSSLCPSRTRRSVPRGLRS